ncbi:hypothetical protein AN641_00330 [Candidatus Epulonipiscioides gigas]|nr:hypothetical protein AN641_00330 [Epulopiscium sp. SCG-C07WGA-EpuloA2]
MSTISSSGLSFSGLASGMDTDAMVEAMVSGYKSKYDTEQKDKLLLELKLEKYKEINTKVVDFYDDYIRQLRLESTFSSSTTSSSNPDKVEITSGGKTGDQITIEQLAKPIVVQTGKVGTTELTADTKLVDLGISSLDGFRFTDDDGNTIDIGVTAEDGSTSLKTVEDLVSAINDELGEGTVKFEKGRFDFSGMNTNGKSDYTITALEAKQDSTTGKFVYEEPTENLDQATDDLLGNLGISARTEWEENEDWEEGDPDEDRYIITSSQYISEKLEVDGITGSTKLSELGVSGTLDLEIDGNSYSVNLSENMTLDELSKKLSDIGLDTKFDSKTGAFNINPDDGIESLSISASKSDTLSKLGIKAPEGQDEGNKVILGDGDDATTFEDLGFKDGDRIFIDTGGPKPQVLEISHGPDKGDYDNKITTVQDLIDTMGETSVFNFDEETNSFTINKDAVKGIRILTEDMYADELFGPGNYTAEEKGQYSLDRLESMGITANIDSDGNTTYETNSVGTSNTYTYEGQKAKATYNGMEVESDTNVFKLDGITFVAKEVTGEDEYISVDKTIDDEELFKTVENFVNAYNTLIEELNGLVDAEYNSEYQPLLSEEKEGMSDSDLELWNDKIDNSLLRNDPQIEALLDSMRNTLMEVFPQNDSFKSLYDIGIETSTDYQENGKLILDEEKLKEAISKDAEGIKELFVGNSETGTDGYAEKMYDNVTDLLKGTDSSSSMFLFNDLDLEKAILDQQEEIDKAYDTMLAKEEIYQAQFLAMEMAIQQLNSQANLFTTA